ncbi:MAG: polyprenyl synthetase family protein [Anaerolineales bacterium]|nr:polyprenyl synthetase family protein [Anaerolineales bacterium]
MSGIDWQYRRFRLIGIAFQIVDDILDLSGKQDYLGKPCRLGRN